MKFKLLMLALSLSATGIATAMVGSDADRQVATNADVIAYVLAPEGYAHAASFSHLAAADASFGMPALSLHQSSPSEADANSEFGSQVALDRFLLQIYPHDSTASQTAVHIAAVTTPSDITQVGHYDAAYQLSPHVPEPQTWAILLAGLGLIGLQLRRTNHVRMAIN